MNHRHYFADYQHCLKCGKWEGAPQADDCTMSHEEYDQLERRYGPAVRTDLARMHQLLAELRATNSARDSQ